MHRRIPTQAYALLIALLLCANGFTYAALLHDKERVLRVSFLDVGQGDSILIESPSGAELLIDGGKDGSAARMLPRELGPLDRTLDAVLATHPDADHIGGLPAILARYRVGTFLEPGRTHASSQAEQLQEEVAQEGAAHVLLTRGMRLHLGGGAYADVLHPEDNVSKLRDTNDASVVLRLVYGDTAFMLTGDAAEWVEERLVTRHGSELRSDVLKAGHHGSKTSTGDAFLGAVQPQIVVISAGRGNSYGHPHPEVLENIREAGAATVGTYDHGTITFVSDGVQITQR